MGTLGKYLRDARETQGIDLREAAQQTRISLQYLKALEAEDFSKLPGAVFVRGFLKNYSKFLQLDETEVMKKFGELQQPPLVTEAQTLQTAPQPTVEEPTINTSAKLPFEPFIWGSIIVLVLVIALFAALPPQRRKEIQQSAATSTLIGGATSASSGEQLKPEKLYLEVIAVENTWILVRTDTSPQKKAILAKGESLIWSADERFLVSYGSAGALRLILNGKELNVDEPKNTVIKELTITSSGILNRKIQGENVQPPKRLHPAPSPAIQSMPSASATVEMQSKPSETAGDQVREQHNPKIKPAPVPKIPVPITVD
ncbi:MAG TPA: RodZ domain-containing protein [Nitrospirota bacterium]|nr:RodZ domain-containing protein [Nitrospirota bacterium]